MKQTRFANLLVMGLALTFAAVGCKHTPVGVTPIPRGAQPIVGGPSEAPAINPGLTPGEENPNPTPIPEPGPADFVNYTPDTQMFKADTIHFAFDSSVIRSSDMPKVAAVADYLKTNPQDAVRVEGNCDERGTEEYNRALGSRRALAGRQALINLGVDPNRVLTISYGEDRPVDPAHNQAAWAKNRRDDFVLLTPPQQAQ